MLNICCVQVGNYEGRGAEYVNTLFDMARRNLAEGYPGKFVCFTDDPRGLDEGIEARPVQPGLTGWWNKLYLFKSGVFREGERVLYFDLDTLITGRLDEIAGYAGEFAIMADLFKPVSGPFSGWQSGVMAWRGGFGSHLWEEFEKAGFPDVVGGDQAWIASHQPTADLFQNLYPDLFVSYKATGGEIPTKASVVCFHGHPRPHEVLEGWVPQVWRKGGLSRADLDTICNTQNAILQRNIRYACSLDLPWFDFAPDHDRHVCLIGGGPSLQDSVNEIAAMKAFGHQIWALNGTHDWLVSRGIMPDAMVLLDARADNVRFVRNPRAGVTYYVASQCDQAIFDALKGMDVVVYHNLTEGAPEILEEIATKTAHLFGGGTTVGMKAMILARKMGYKSFHLYGFDSCYRLDEHHAYEQDLNSGERVLEAFCSGRQFKCAPWMITQAQDFERIAHELIEDDCTLVVAGDGLIPHIARMMSAVQDSPDQFKVVDGIKWPKGDYACRVSAEATIGDIPQIAALCDRRSVCVQAGGNVGLWPMELSRLFKTVFTFEPDPENYACLSENTSGYENIVHCNAALGSEHGKAGMHVNKTNCGASYIDGDGEIEVVTVDSLNLTACDLIYLDVEGYERHALEGAQSTIERFSPVVCIEETGHTERYGKPASEWLLEHGYKEVARFHRDVVYRRG